MKTYTVYKNNAHLRKANARAFFQALEFLKWGKHIKMIFNAFV